MSEWMRDKRERDRERERGKEKRMKKAEDMSVFEKENFSIFI